MDQYPKHIIDNINENKQYYSLELMSNIERAKDDKEYLGDLMLVNENLIWHSIHKYIGKPETIAKNNSIEKDDILQLGRIGFIKAVKAFDTTRGVRFSSFGVTAIVREIRSYLRDSTNILRPTRTANALINKINKIEYDLGYLPSIEELVKMLGEKEWKITKALQVGQPVKYLEEPIKGDSLLECNIPLIETISESDVFDSQGLEEQILDQLYVNDLISSIKHKLSNKELQVLKTRVEEGLNQSQTAVKEQISQMRVSRIMRKVAKLLSDKDIDRELPPIKN